MDVAVPENLRLGLRLEAQHRVPSIEVEDLLETWPDANVVFAGDGELREELESRAHELGVSGHVRFTGFLETDNDVYNVLTGCGLALATYPPDDTNYKKYCDPGKVKFYLACGLPVLITDVPAVAREIETKGAGVIVEHDPSRLAETVCSIFADKERYEHMREQAIGMAGEYKWDVIWKRTFLNGEWR